MKTRALSTVALTLSYCLVGCSSAALPPSTKPEGTAEQTRRTSASWCESIEEALGKGASGFECLPVPNFLVTGFYGPRRNPDRSDFANGCFAGAQTDERLRMSVRPAGQLRFSHHSAGTVAANGSVDLGFLGPWAPSLNAGARAGTELRVSVELEDAEVRVLSSVGEILGQTYESADLEAKTRDALETCLDALCRANEREPLLYTAKVLAAVPVIRISTSTQSAQLGQVRLVRGLAEFEVGKDARDARELVIRGKEKLNVAALMEPAQPAFERAMACSKVVGQKSRRELRARLRQLGLRVLAGRELSTVAQEAATLRQLADRASSALAEAEQAQLLRVLESVELYAQESSAPKPGKATCSARSLLETALTSSGGGKLDDLVADVAEPVHERLTQLANGNALSCAEPAWFADEDRDGFGDPSRLVRARKQPPGHVANALDCYDRSRDARPGQTGYFVEPRGDGSFDYDCDGKENPQQDLLAGGCQSITRLGIPIRCWAESGWEKRVPACGREGQWLSGCSVSMLSCDDPEHAQRRQTCR